MNKKLLLMFMCTYGYMHSMHEFRADLVDPEHSSRSADRQEAKDMTNLYHQHLRDAQRHEQRPTTKLPEETIRGRSKTTNLKQPDLKQPETGHVTFRDLHEARPEQKERVAQFAQKHNLSAENQAKLITLFEKINALRPEEQRNIQEALREFTLLTPRQQEESLMRLQNRATELESEQAQARRSARYTDPYGNYYQDPFMDSYMEVQETFFLMDLFNALMEILASIGSGAVEMASSVDLASFAALFL